MVSYILKSDIGTKFGIRPPVPEHDRHDPVEFQIADMKAFDKFSTFEYPLVTYTNSPSLAWDSNQDPYEDEHSDDDNDGDGRSSQASKFPDVEECHIALFGTTSAGNSICVAVPYHPYFYLKVPSDWGSEEFDKLQNYLSFCIRVPPRQMKMTTVNRTLLTWDPDPNDYTKRLYKKYLKISFPNRKRMGWAVNRFKNPLTIRRLCDNVQFEVQEDAYAFSTALKFCDDTGVTPSSWVQLDAYCSSIQPNTKPNSKTFSNCQLEYKLSSLNQIKPLPDKIDLAPTIVASVDIETIDPNNQFPVPEREDNQIVTIGISIYRTGDSNICRRIALCLHKTDDVKGVDIISCKTEKELLEVYRDIMVYDIDPDVVIGYNILGFDWKYIGERMTLWHTTNPKMASLFYMSRLTREHTPLMADDFNSNAYGSLDRYNFFWTGRFIMDMFHRINRDHKLSNYSLKAVAKKYLDQQEKIDLPYKLIYPYFMDGPAKRAEVARYCSMDCDLPILLMNKLCKYTNMIEMSKLSATTLSDLIRRGQQVKAFNQLVYHGHRHGFNIHPMRKEEAKKYVGATVVEPDPGYYPDPIATLDFASLYPSIMISNNMCYSTLVPPEHMDKINKPGVIVKKCTPSTGECYFVQSTPGLLPIILDYLLTTRRSVKQEMKTHKKGSLQYMILDGKQLALKVTANSLYGFTGTAEKGILPCRPIASSVTWFGRGMIDDTSKLVHAEYKGCGVNGEDAHVIYGDTDSVMVRFFQHPTEEGVKETFRLGNEAGKKITKMFHVASRASLGIDEVDIDVELELEEKDQRGGDFCPKYKVVDMEMEKVTFPYMLFGKKRYAGVAREYFEEKPKLDVKGIQMVRRDYSGMTIGLQKKVFNMLLFDIDPKSAAQQIQQTSDDLLNDRIPFEDFIISKSMKQPSSYKKPHDQITVQVSSKMNARESGSGYVAGDRVQYVIVENEETRKKKPKIAKRAEQADYAKEHKVPIDRIYYLQKQIITPMTDIVKLIYNNPAELYAEVKRKLNNKRNGQKTLFDMCGPSSTFSPKKRKVTMLTSKQQDEQRVKLKLERVIKKAKKDKKDGKASGNMNLFAMMSSKKKKKKRKRVESSDN